MIKCAQVLYDIFFASTRVLNGSSIMVAIPFTFYSHIWKILLIYGKVDSSLFAYIVNLFGCFESKYQKFFPTPIVVKPYWKYIGITFLIYNTDLQNQILLEESIYLLLTHRRCTCNRTYYFHGTYSEFKQKRFTTRYMLSAPMSPSCSRSAGATCVHINLVACISFS